MNDARNLRYLLCTLHISMNDSFNLFLQGCVISFNGAVLQGPGYITAQARGEEKDPSGFVFKDCVVVGTGWTYLGRPWRPYARVIFYNSTFSNIIVPAGWDPWFAQSNV